MNGIEKITARIESDAGKEAQSLSLETAERCASMRKAYDTKAQEAYWALVRSGVKDCEARVRQLGVIAAQEAKKSVLSMKQEMVVKSLSRAEELLCRMPEKEYTGLLSRLAAKAAKTGLEELVFNESDKVTVGPKVSRAANALMREQGKYGKLTVSELSADIKGGVIVKQGDIEINCSIEAMVSMYRDELSTQMASVLFDN